MDTWDATGAHVCPLWSFSSGDKCKRRMRQLGLSQKGETNIMDRFFLVSLWIKAKGMSSNKRHTHLVRFQCSNNSPARIRLDSTSGALATCSEIRVTNRARPEVIHPPTWAVKTGAGQNVFKTTNPLSHVNLFSHRSHLKGKPTKRILFEH